MKTSAEIRASFLEFFRSKGMGPTTPKGRPDREGL
jgi:hypothetical protein